MNGNDSDHAFTRLRCMLVVFGQASVTPLPRIGPLDDPTHRQRFEARLSFRTAHDLQPVRPAGGETTIRTTRDYDTWHPRRPPAAAESRARGPERTRPGPLGHRPRWYAVTTTAIKKPRESTRIWRFRPCTFLPPSIPRCLPPKRAVLTDWLSIAARAGRVGDRLGLGAGQRAKDIEEFFARCRLRSRTGSSCTPSSRTGSRAARLARNSLHGHDRTAR